MAVFSVARAKHATLAPSAVDTVTLTAPVVRGIRVFNRASTQDLYVRIDQVDPVVSGDDSQVVIAASNRLFVPPSTTFEVRLIPSVAASYSVEVED